jgi:hypothetical protein
MFHCKVVRKQLRSVSPEFCSPDEIDRSVCGASSVVRALVVCSRWCEVSPPTRAQSQFALRGREFVLSRRSNPSAWASWCHSARATCRRAVSDYVEHYRRERNHQGVGNRLLMPARPAPRPLTRTRRSNATSGSADCSASTTGAPHESAIDFLHTTGSWLTSSGTPS